MYVGVYTDDNTTNTGVPQVFTSASTTTESTSIIQNVEDIMPSQDKGDVDDTHAKQFGSSSDSPVIQTLLVITFVNR